MRRVELAGARQLRFHELRQGEVHVVAAEQQVIADRLADEAQLARLFDRLNQAEIAGAAADIDDGTAGAGVELLNLARRMRGQPAVEGGLWLFEQGDVFEPCFLGRLDGEIASHIVERRRHGQHHLLLFESIIGLVASHCVVPRFDHVAEITRRGFDGRDAMDFGRRAPGQERRRAIDAGVTEPRLSRRYQPARHLGAMIARELTDGEIARTVPRQGRGARRQVVCSGHVEKRGKQRSPGGFARCHELRNREDLNIRLAGRSAAAQVDVGQRAIRCAEVDADQEMRHGSLRTYRGCRVILSSSYEERIGEKRAKPAPRVALTGLANHGGDATLPPSGSPQRPKGGTMRSRRDSSSFADPASRGCPPPEVPAPTTFGALRRHLNTLAIAAFLFTTQVGCFWAIAGATCAGVAGYAYWQGKMCHAYVADIADAMKATKTALTELGMAVNKEELGDDKAVIKTRAADGTHVTIKFRRESSQIPSEGSITQICVRVGAFGDHPLSGRILYQISSHLVPVTPPGAGPVAGAPMVAPGPMPPPAPGAPPNVPALPSPRVLPGQPPLAPPGAPAPPPPPITPASWAPVNTGEPPLSDERLVESQRRGPGCPTIRAVALSA